MQDEAKQNYPVAPFDLIDDLPSSRPSRPLQQALALVDAGKRERDELRAERDRYRVALEQIVPSDGASWTWQGQVAHVALNGGTE